MSNQSIMKSIVEAIAILLQGLTADERVEFWASIHKGYCRHCGIETPEGVICHCWNDD